MLAALVSVDAVIYGNIMKRLKSNITVKLELGQGM
jgi:hypothetical protein